MLSPSWNTKAIFFGLLLAIEFLSVSTLAQSNPVPFVNHPLVPDAAKPGSQDIILTVNGTGFVLGSVVQWNGTPLTTTFMNSSQLTALVPSTDLTIAGTASVSVVTPGPGGGRSDAAFFSIRGPFPAISFDQIPLVSGVAPNSVVTADLNNDGKLDLIASNVTNSRVSILLGNGNGTFQTRVNYPVAESPQAIVVVDLNNDGNLDLAVSTGGFVSVLLGKGDGTFEKHTDYSTGGVQGLSITAGDFNEDGNVDLAVALSSGAKAAVLLGNGDGTLQGPVLYTAGSDRAFGITTGDFNRDGKLDLAVGVFLDSAVAILFGNGDGTFQETVEIPTAPGAQSVVAGDFDGDGNLDLAVKTGGGGGIGPEISVLIGNGDGTFQPHRDCPARPGSFGITSADLNGDNQLDLVVPNSSSLTLSTFLGKGNGSFRLDNLFSTGKSPASAASGDFDGDGRLDIVVANEGENTLSLMKQATAVLSRTFLEFGTVKIGESSTIRVKFTNIGNKVFAIKGITLSGSKASQFAESNDCSAQLSPGMSCTISVTFKPQVTGKITGVKVKVADSAVRVLQIIYLQGVGAS